MSCLGEKGAVCGKRLKFLWNGPYEQVKYNVWGRYIKYLRV